MHATLQQITADRTVRFVITGCGAAVLFYALTYGCLRLGLPPAAAVLAAYAVTVSVSYTVQHAWTFGGEHVHARSFPRYLVAQVLSASLTSFAGHVLAGWALSPAILSAGTTLLGSGLSYGLSRYWVFAGPKASAPSSF